jgi:hypothetical protein
MTPSPYWHTDGVTLHAGDCLNILADMPDNSVDAIVTDPPYSLSFMSAKWDTHDTPHAFQQWCQQWATQAHRVMKPGAHLLAFGGTRTFHRLACAIEDAGFEIRDSIAWLHSQGFAKSLDVSKAIDKAAGAARTEVTGIKLGHENFVGRDGYKSVKGDGALSGEGGFARPWMSDPDRSAAYHQTFAPVTPDAQQWAGWGSAMKPAHESIVCARKPLVGTLAQNVLTYGTGALNIDAARIAHGEDVNLTKVHRQSAANDIYIGGAKPGDVVSMYKPGGRWPANVVLDGGYPGSAADTLDEQTGISCSSVRKPSGKDERGIPNTASSIVVRRNDTHPRGVADSGGASRFFKVVHASPADHDPAGWPDPFAAPFVPWRYEAKAPTSERPRVSSEGAGNGRVTGLGGKVRQCNVCQTRAIESGAGEPSCGHGDYRWEAPTTEAVNTVAHPTVKPLDLIRWLVRLITPPGGTVLDMFAGSGTTGEACVVEGFPVILVERDVTYLPLIVARLSKPIQPDLFGGLDTPAPAPPPAGRAQAGAQAPGDGAGEAVPGQLGLFDGA